MTLALLHLLTACSSDPSKVADDEDTEGHIAKIAR